MNFININKRLIMLKKQKKSTRVIQFIDEIIKLIITLIDNIRNIVNKDDVFKFIFEKHLIVSDKRY